MRRDCPVGAFAVHPVLCSGDYCMCPIRLKSRVRTAIRINAGGCSRVLKRRSSRCPMLRRCFLTGDARRSARACLVVQRHEAARAFRLRAANRASATLSCVRVYRASRRTRTGILASRANASGDGRYRSFPFANFDGVRAANEVCTISPVILSAVSMCVLVESCPTLGYSSGERFQCVTIQLN
jgi:hypothetical protein